MSNWNDGADASQATGESVVQTSAQATAEVVHQEPAVGGSYIRNSATGDLVKQEPADEQTDQE